MQRFVHFVHNENIALYEKLIAESECNPSRDENRHAMLLILLAEEKAKDRTPLKSQELPAAFKIGAGQNTN
jgi:hypothetical protein